MFKKIEKTLNRNKRKTFSLYNNILAGIITGSFIGSIFPFFKKAGESGFISNWIINLFLIIVLLIVGFKAGKWALRIATKDESEYSSYRSNFIAGLVASIYTIAMISLSLTYRLFILIPISVIALIIILYLNAKIRRK